MINGISLAMVAGIGLRTVARVIHTYPTQAEAIKMAADAYRGRGVVFRGVVVANWLKLEKADQGKTGAGKQKGRGGGGRPPACWGEDAGKGFLSLARRGGCVRRRV